MADSALSSNDANFKLARLERAATRANNHWFPCNPDLITKIQNGLRDGNYDLDIEFLLNEIKTDFALFMYCIKEALVMLKAEGVKVASDINPFAILRSAGLPRVRKILDKCEQRISTHNLLASSSVQHGRIKEAMISASAAEALSSFQAIDPEVGFSAALLRQLGLALIAWNYPSVYQTALERCDEGVSLEAALDQSLGFSPTLFGSFLLGRWGVPDEIRVVVGSDPSQMQSDSLTEIQLYLKKVCEVGEALARAENPELNPSAEADWNTARAAIENIVGPEGIRIVQEHVRQNCESYRALLKTEFADTVQLNPGARIAANREELLEDRNPFVRGCLPYLKKAFKDLYSSMDQNTISQHSVRTLTNDIIPLAGFSGGCVFVLDPTSKQFTPRLTIGKVVLRSLGAIPYRENSMHSDPIVVAYECQTPMIEHSRSIDLETPACISAVIGAKQRIGVLYLEVPQSALSDYDQNILTHFKAVRKALEDALHVS